MDVKLTMPVDVDYDLEVVDTDGNVLFSSYYGGDTPEEVRIEYVPSTVYYIHVFGYTGFSGSSPYSLVTSAVTNFIDNYEPNDTMETAYAIATGTSRTSYISHAADEDYYKVKPTATGMIQILLTAPVDSYFNLDVTDVDNNYLSTNSLITDSNVTKIDFWGVAGQTYYIWVAGYVDYSTYTLQVKSPVKDTYEESVSYHDVQAGMTYTSYISTDIDYDYYNLYSENGGMVTLTFKNPTGKGYRAEAYTGDLYVSETLSTTAMVGLSNTLTVVLKPQQSLYIIVDGNGTFTSTYPYIITLSQVLTDTYEPNDTLSGAYTLKKYDYAHMSFLGTTTDLDYYQFKPLSNQGHVTLKVPTGKNFDVIIYDGEQNVIATGDKVAGETEEVRFAVVPGKSYYLKIFAPTGDASSTEPYTFAVNDYAVTYTYSDVNLLKRMRLQEGTHVSFVDFLYDRNGNLIKRTNSSTELK